MYYGKHRSTLNRLSIDCRSTCWPTVDQLSTESQSSVGRSTIDRLLVDQAIVGRHFTAYVPTVGRRCSDQSRDSMRHCQPIFDRQSPDTRPIVDMISMLIWQPKIFVEYGGILKRILRTVRSRCKFCFICVRSPNFFSIRNVRIFYFWIHYAWMTISWNCKGFGVFGPFET